MTQAIALYKTLISSFITHPLKEITPDLEAEAYYGFNFTANEIAFKFRKAKVTPKKTGLFVTLWQRNAQGITEPFNVGSPFDFYLIATIEEDKKGFFIFPKQVLSTKHILTSAQKEGKRGFRVYPTWCKPGNKQAQKTQAWQTDYFINLADGLAENSNKYHKILASNNHAVYTNS